MLIAFFVILKLFLLQKFQSEEIYLYNGANYDWTNSQCANVKEEERVDCLPESSLSPYYCLKRGCCWNEDTFNKSAPNCYFGSNYGLYKVKEKQNTEHGITVHLELVNKYYSAELISDPIVQIDYKNSDQLRIKIWDSLENRFEVPIPLNQVDSPKMDVNYEVTVVDFPFALIVTRKDPELVIFDSRVAPFIFADQFLSISTALNGSYVYGLGGRWGHSYIPLEWGWYPLLNVDHRPQIDTNGYGTHPYYIVSNEESVYGVLFYNSNPQEFASYPSKQLTWRSLGGIFDIYLFMGPTTEDIMKQYTDLVGRSTMPPFWSLGFHICKWGYTSTDDVRDIVHKMKSAKIPQDAQWTDIDYMEKTREFTFSWSGFGDLPELNKQLHDDDLYHVIIAEPHVFAEDPAYLPYKDGIKMNAFVRDNTNTSFQKQPVWPGECHYVDFGSKQGSDYWTFQLKRFYNMVKFDGLWIDMNDPSSFKQSCGLGKYNYPSYVPKNLFYPFLYTKTVCMDAIHTLGLHIDVHNIYATLEAKDTYKALRTIKPKERPLIISRSHFITHGAVSGTWSGDTISTYFDMKNSISDVIRSNLMGISLTGGDICGFAEEANEKLCTRWYLIGAFYPFMRSHADHSDKTPFGFSEKMTSVAKKIIEERYKLLPFLYTLFHYSYVYGTPVIQPLFFNWNNDPKAHMVDDQFMWSTALLVSPAIENDIVTGYFPQGMWYDYWQKTEPFYSKGQYRTMETPFDQINVHVLGGNIIPIQGSALRTQQSRKTPFTLLAYANSSYCHHELARGNLFWDDGVSYETYKQEKYNLFDFTLKCSGNQYEFSSIANVAYAEPMALKSVQINGVPHPNSKVTVNGIEKEFTYNSKLQLLVVDNLDLSMLADNVISWS